MISPSTALSSLEVARQAAFQAGQLIREKFPRSQGPREWKVAHKGRIDLVTEVDQASEAILRKVILDAFPEDAFLGEEGGCTGQSQRRWICDPLDGTRSFAHGYPFVAVSIALEVDGEIQLGLVYDPIHEETFEATLGRGASLNGQPISVSQVTDLEQALAITGFPYHLREIDHAAIFGLFGKMVLKAAGIRRDGAAALDLCYLACGRVDVFWEFFLQPWDSAAGSLILREAGGQLSGLDGQPFDIYQPEMLASNGFLQKALEAECQEYGPRIRPWLKRWGSSEE